MFGKSREYINPGDVNPIKLESTSHSEHELTSIRDLKSKLEDIFSFNMEEFAESQLDISAEPPFEGRDMGTVTLDDGTVVKLPDTKDTKAEVSATDVQSNQDVSPDMEQRSLAASEINSLNKETKIDAKTDDNGNIYFIDGKLLPNTTYELNGNIYTTDAKGRIISCKATPVRTPENLRDNEAQQQAGGNDRKPNDQGGHIVGRDMNGNGGIGNLIAMDSKINQSDFKRMENDVKAALDKGKDVSTKTEITYGGDSERPDRITVTVTTDETDTVYKFDNNLDGSLRAEVPENGKELVQKKLDESGGEISSIKEEYDKDGNLVKTTVCITYAQDGITYRDRIGIIGSGGD